MNVAFTHNAAATSSRGGRGGGIMGSVCLGSKESAIVSGGNGLSKGIRTSRFARREPAHHHGPRNVKAAFTACWMTLAALGCAGRNPPPSSPSETPPVATAVLPVESARAVAIVQASDRLDADRQLDAGRHPAEPVTFLVLDPG